MKIIFLVVGKTTDSALNQLESFYLGRLQHYASVTYETIPALKKTKKLLPAEQKAKEAQRILSKCLPGDKLILLDEKGKEFSSPGFADWLEKQFHGGSRRLVFVVGGPYGFDTAVYQRADALISLSKLTFSHQMVRLFFLEQLYRAFSILNNEPYHHE